jgi:hypothetical protein
MLTYGNRAEMIIKELGTMASNPQKTNKVAPQLLPFSCIFRNGDGSRATYAAFTVLKRLEVTMPSAAANFITQSRKAAKKKRRKLSFSLPSRLRAFA